MENVYIIGAGPAGLTAAYELLKDKSGQYNVIVLEGSSVIGGISQTVQYHDNRMDIGGHRFFSKDDRVMQWWQEMMPFQGAPSMDDKELHREKKLTPGGPDPEKEDRVMLVRQRVSRIYYNKKFFDYPISLKPATFKNLGLGTTIVAGCSYLKSVVHKLPEDSLENFYINRFGKKLYSIFFESYTEKLWGRHPSEISADWGAQRVKGLSIMAIIKDFFTPKSKKDQKKGETSLIEEFYYPKYGPGQLWETVAKEVENLGGKVIMNALVTGVHTNGKNQVESLTYVKDGQSHTVEGDIFMSTMPVKDLIASMNNVPADLCRIAEGLPYRDFVTVGLLVDRLNLKNETDIPTLGNIVPDCWIYVQDASVKVGRIQIFNNWSPYMVKDPKNTVWIGLEYFCKEGDDFWNMPEEECVQNAIQELIKMGILESEAVVRDTHREKIKKAYPAYFDTYDEMDKLVEYLSGFENLYCMGRNGQHRYNNMDHSMATAFESVDNIHSGKKTKENIWNVNTEKVYHEEKST